MSFYIILNAQNIDVFSRHSLLSVAGIMMAFACLGPAMGYILGGLFLNIYVDVGRIDEE